MAELVPLIRHSPRPGALAAIMPMTTGRSSTESRWVVSTATRRPRAIVGFGGRAPFVKGRALSIHHPETGRCYLAVQLSPEILVASSFVGQGAQGARAAPP